MNEGLTIHKRIYKDNTKFSGVRDSEETVEDISVLCVAIRLSV